jgi:selenocysteine lyase/cysteine desulfurase
MLGLPLLGDRASVILEALRNPGVVASVRGSSLRLSPQLHTTQGDIEHLMTALGSALRR